MSTGTEKEEIKTAAVRWFLGQEANTIINFLLLFAIGWLAYYAIKEGIPAHLSAIHQNYKQLNDDNNGQQKEARSDYLKARDEDRQFFEKMMDRIERPRHVVGSVEGAKSGAADNAN